MYRNIAPTILNAGDHSCLEPYLTRASFVENNVSKVRERPCLEILPQYSTLCSFPSFLYLLFVHIIQDCQSDRVMITDEATGEFIQALSEFSYFETVS
jgi:hypothetical protein